MLDADTKRRIDTARDILVGKVPDPKSQVEQITIALIYKFMDDMDAQSEELGGVRSFFSGEFARFGWAKLVRGGLGGHETLNLYADAITRMPENPGVPQLFRDIFKNAFLPYRDPETLRAFLKIIDEFNYDHSERLGDAFEYLLSVLGSQGDAGQFRTPRHIIDFMVEIVDPKKDEKILDPACGTAGFLISAYKHVLKANTDENGGSALSPDERTRLAANLKGYDISPDMVRLSLANMYLHGFTDPHISEYDTLTSEDNWNEFADVILANPPFMSPTGGIRPHKRFSVNSKRSEVLFVDYMAGHLTAGGRAGIIVPEGIIFQSQNAYKQLRKMLVDEYLVAVVSLPAGVFNPYAGVKTSVLILDRALARRTNHIAFFKVENDGYDLGAQRREIDKNDLPRAKAEITEYLRRLRAGESLDDFDPTLGLIVEKEKIEENGEYNLSGERYRESGARQSNWPMVTIGELCETASGGTPLKSKSEYYQNGTIPWIRSGEIAQGLIEEAEVFITEEGLRNSSAKKFPKDTVVVAMYGATAGEVGILGFEASTNQAICGIMTNQRFIPGFLFNLLKSKKNEMVGLASGGAQPNISQRIIRNLEIPLPPLEVQKEVVAEIEGYQKVIDGALAVVDNYRPHISVDPEWPMVALGEVFEKSAETVLPKLLNGSVTYIGLENITKNTGQLTGDVVKGNPSEVKSLKNVFYPNDILYGKLRPNLNKVWLSDQEGICSTDIFVVRPLSHDVIPAFYAYTLRSEQFNNAILSQVEGAQLPRIGWRSFAGTHIPLPPLETQQTIVAEIEAEQAAVESNHKLIDRFEKKIEAVIARVWGEDA